MSTDFKKHHVRFNSIVKVIKSRDVNTLKNILKNKHIELMDSKFETVLHCAARHGDVEVIKMLLEDWRIARLLDSEMYNGDTPLMSAARKNHVAAVQVLADHGANVWKLKMDYDNTILHFAAALHDSDLLSTLLARIPSAKVIDKKNVFGETPLDVALMHYSSNFTVLLQAGASYDKPNHFTGRNILHSVVAYDRCEALQDLLASQSSRKLTNLTDHRGDTPLMLAIRMGCTECVKLLIRFVKLGKETNEITGESLLHIAVMTNSSEILSEVLMFSQEHIISYNDIEGRTPLILAIQFYKNNCLKKLMNTQNAFEKNTITQDTALHAAVKYNNIEAQSIMLENNNPVGTWCFAQKNRDGKTPLWVAVENNNAQFVAEARKGRCFNVEEINEQGDSCMYVAAAWGHLGVLKTLLLSDKFYSFCRTYEKNIDFTGRTMVKEAEISCDIYSSDIFILSDEIRKNTSHTWFPKTFLHVNERTGRNIFHACALGGQVYCLDFVYVFIKMFAPRYLNLFDCQGHYGNTPLQLATINHLGGPECVYYFLSHHADVSSCNNQGESVLESILKNTEHSTDLLTCVLNQGIVYDQEAKGLQEESESLRVNFSIIRPAEPIIKVVRLFYDKIHGEHRYKVLQHTLFKIYVHLVLASVNYFFIIRFILSFICVILLVVYIIFFSHVTSNNPLVLCLTYLLRFLNILGLTFSVPLLCHNEFTFIGILTITLMISPCLLVLFLTTLRRGSNFFFEIAAITVLISFFSLKMYCTMIFRNISHQMAMLSQVIYGMFTYTGSVILVIWAFSLVLYCIFNKDFYFVDPLKSFIYTANVLLLDETSESFNYFQAKHFSENKTHVDRTEKTISDIFASQMDLYLECSIILAFIIMVNLGLTNMLVSLAVRDAKILEASGSIFRRHLQIYWLTKLELFLGSIVYRIIRRTPLVYLFGVVPSRTLIDVSMVYYPMFDKNSTKFTQQSIRELKQTLGRKGSQTLSHTLEEQKIVEVIPRRKTDPM